MKDEKKHRRGFLKAALAVIATAGLTTISSKVFKKEEGKKVKMLSPDGKLVEVDESVISKAGSTKQRASNREVQHWMKTSKT